MRRPAIQLRRPVAVLAAGIVATILCGCSGVSAQRTERMDEATRERLQATLGSEFPDVYAKLVKAKSDLTPEELLDGLHYERSRIYSAPDKDHIELLRAGKAWADPRAAGGGCPGDPFSWKQDLLWETLDLFVEGKRNPTRRRTPDEADLAAFTAAVADPQQAAALDDFMLGGLMPAHPEARCKLLYDWYDTLLRLPPDQAVRISIRTPTWLELLPQYPMAEFNPRIRQADSDE